MSSIVIAMDLGTSGFRAQAIEPGSGEIISTAITLRHPLPGGNVIDHVNFALELGTGATSQIIIQAVNRVIHGLHISVDEVVRLVVCGNPAQLSLFQGIEIRDLAFGGQQKLDALGVVTPQRDAAVIKAVHFPGLALPEACDVIVPPAVRCEVGADALALIIQTGMIEKNETAIAIDFGTNTEIALFYKGCVFTGSSAAGSAIEGQEITCGMLAMPKVVSDLNPAGSGHRLIQLDSEMLPIQGDIIDISRKGVITNWSVPRPVGITGTGVIAIVQQAIESGLVQLPRIATTDRQLHIGEDIFFTEGDLAEAGKAFGAIRAGLITLCQMAGIKLEDISTAYMSGTSGTFVDAIKAQKLGLIPPRLQTIYQLGNTSLAMARNLALDLKVLDIMIVLAGQCRKTYCMFASSDVFKKIYLLEYSYWTEGMPMMLYRKYLRKYGFPDLLPVQVAPSVIRIVKRDIDDYGRKGLTIIEHIGRVTEMDIDGCILCMKCVNECPGKAIVAVGGTQQPGFAVDESLCHGVGCRQCERVCTVKVFKLDMFFNTTSGSKDFEEGVQC